jgi:hypothetical protein
MTTRKSRSWLFPMSVAFVAAIFLSCSSPTKSDNGSDTGTTTGTGSAVLTKLGVNTNLGARTLSDGTAMTDTDNPFGKTVVNLKRTPEVFVVSADNTVQLLDPVLTTPPSNPPLLSTPTALSVGSSALADFSDKKIIKRPVSADIDGDGKDEIVIAAFVQDTKKIMLFAIDNGSSYNIAAKSSIDWETKNTYYSSQDYGKDGAWPNEIAVLDNTRAWSQTIDIASGDLNGDGNDEIAISSEGRLYILNSNLTLLTTMDFPILSGASTGSQVLRVECGDLDSDGSSELVVGNGTYDKNITAQVSVLKLSGSSLSLVLGPISASVGSGSLRSAEIAIGDVDGDGLPEAVVAGISIVDGGPCLAMIINFTVTNAVIQGSFLNVSPWSDDLNSGVNDLSYDRASSTPYFRDLDSMVPILAVANLDGRGSTSNGVDEIIVNDDIIYLKGAGTATAAFAAAFDSTSNEILRSGLSDVYLPGSTVGGWVVWGNRAPDTAYFNQLMVGDLNGDGRDEIVLVDFTKDNLRQYYYSDSSNHVVKGSDVAITGTLCPFLCLADVDSSDSDSPVVKYKGHSLVFSDPIIVAVLSSPPYWNKKDSDDNLIQDTSQMQTTLGFTAGASFGVGANVGFAIGATVGEKAEVPVIANGEETVKLTVTQSYSASFEAEVSGQIEVTYNCPAGVDKVLFTSVPIDVYEFEDISDPTKQYFVKEQRKPEMQFVNVDFYNANNGDYPDIGSTVLKGHVIGNPYSYPTLDTASGLNDLFPDASYIIEKLKSGSDLLFPGVPQGSGYTTLQYSAEGTVGASYSINTEVKVEQEASFVAIEGSSFALSFGVTVSASVTAGTFVSGGVGGLEDAYYTSGYRYDWGIFSYTQTLGNTFMVVNYWVDPR